MTTGTDNLYRCPSCRAAYLTRLAALGCATHHEMHAPLPA